MSATAATGIKLIRFILWAICCLEPAKIIRAGMSSTPPPIPMAPIIPESSPIKTSNSQNTILTAVIIINIPKAFLKTEAGILFSSFAPIRLPAIPPETTLRVVGQSM